MMDGVISRLTSVIFLNKLSWFLNHNLSKTRWSFVWFPNRVFCESSVNSQLQSKPRHQINYLQLLKERPLEIESFIFPSICLGKKSQTRIKRNGIFNKTLWCKVISMWEKRQPHKHSAFCHQIMFFTSAWLKQCYKVFTLMWSMHIEKQNLLPVRQTHHHKISK